MPRTGSRTALRRYGAGISEYHGVLFGGVAASSQKFQIIILIDNFLAVAQDRPDGSAHIAARLPVLGDLSFAGIRD
jgi:hypothetical protein